MRRQCACGRMIRQSASLCAECLTRYGDDRDAWPEWLLWMTRDIQRELNSERRHREVALDERYPSEQPDAVRAAWNYIRQEMV